MPPDPHVLFGYSGPLVMLGWAALLATPLAPRVADAVASLLIPLLLSLAYTALVMAHWAGAEGGFDSLANVMLLFDNPAIALAGWLHYLAFDLFVGAWIARTARAEGIAHLFILPCLVLAFLFGPAGYLAFTGLRAVQRLRHLSVGAVT
ncbi:DUF4281 domain-containing protein [Fertoebacter nigrum]|uniref:DUF4281 domain-containing protein n=1 Tax=Fertoeibacter niger TaxID=2656921 RepID=A0A8X8GXN8_9RHOB|nr:ABA4-like family protein [Fertoeibacter niger]NUB43738.1 DUF4281 domain-containing protein [Fertoeibacter niger]